jgi:hypothetical protein
MAMTQAFFSGFLKKPAVRYRQAEGYHHSASRCSGLSNSGGVTETGLDLGKFQLDH